MGRKNSVLFTFSFIALFYLFTRWLIFKGFNGTDDMHYAMLASRLLNHRFNPFLPDDIYSGRILLIGFQSLIYLLGGINIITTQLGTLLVTIIACYLTVFKILKYDKPVSILIATSLFFFNPVLNRATLGILPDSYIMLVGIFIVLLIKKIIFEDHPGRNVIQPFLLGLILGLSLLIKEIALLFVPFCLILILIYRPSHYLRFICFLLTGFFIVVLLTGFYYYIHTGTAFFKITQINNSDYRYSGNAPYDFKALLIRLIYSPANILITQGFYPVLFGFSIVILQWITNGKLFLRTNFFATAFLLLLGLGLYFPFSLHEYQPIYFDSRHFLFLLPWAVIVSSEYLHLFLTGIQNRNAMLGISFIIMLVCMLSTLNKWQWMIYILQTFFFLILPLIKKYSPFATILFCGILWLSLLEQIFFKNSPWFNEMQVMNHMLPSGFYYFPDHDNMMNWELLRAFNDRDNVFINLEKKPFYIFSRYYSHLNYIPFKSGWFIINKSYTTRSEKFISVMDSLKKSRNYNNALHMPHIEAFFIESPQKLRFIRTLVEGDH